MVELTIKKKVCREGNDRNKPMFVEVPSVIVDAFELQDGDVVEWTYFVNCKNQKKVDFTRKYTGL